MRNYQLNSFYFLGLTVNTSVQVLLDNNNISNYTFIEEGMNSLGYESLNEVFFDVFEIKSKNLDLVKEKRGEFNGTPIIEADLRIKNEIFKNVRFVLTKENKTKINPNLLDYTKVVIYENKSKPSVSSVMLETPTKKEVKSPLIKEKKTVNPKSLVVEQSLIEKTKIEFLESIKGEVLAELKKEVKAGIISDLIKENLQLNFDSVITDNGNKNKLQRILENFNNSFRKEYIELAEKVSRREAMRYAESGGGTNAVQYANGGTMDGSLLITQNLTATNIIDTQNRELVSKLSFDIIGDGTKNSYILNHNLNTYKILINVYDSNTKEIVLPYIVNSDENNTKIQFSNNLELNENYNVIIFG